MKSLYRYDWIAQEWCKDPFISYEGNGKYRMKYMVYSKSPVFYFSTANHKDNFATTEVLH